MTTIGESIARHGAGVMKAAVLHDWERQTMRSLRSCGGQGFMRIPPAIGMSGPHYASPHCTEPQTDGVESTRYLWRLSGGMA